MPYFGYARADRKSQGRESIAAKLVANMITEAGAALRADAVLHTSQAGPLGASCHLAGAEVRLCLWRTCCLRNFWPASGCQDLSQSSA